MTAKRDDSGSIVIVVLLIVPLALLVAAAGFDSAALLADKGHAFATAQAAARAGADEVSPEARRQGKLLLDPGAAERAANDYLEAEQGGWTTTVDASPTAVVVTVEAFQHSRLLRYVGFAGKTIRATGTAVPTQGAIAENR